MALQFRVLAAFILVTLATGLQALQLPQNYQPAQLTQKYQLEPAGNLILENQPEPGADLEIEVEASAHNEALGQLVHMMAGRVPPGGHAVLISLEEKPERAASTRKALGPVDIDFLSMPAVDSKSADHAALYSACDFENWKGALSNGGRAIAASHKKALELAATRPEPFTLILEDDAGLLPVPPKDWLQGFDAAWQRLQHRDVAVVRLGWCQFNGGTPEVEALGNGFQLVHHIRAKAGDPEAPHGINDGLCTTGYIVNKKYVHDILRAFPCHEPVDLFYGHTLFNTPPFTDKVWSITHENSTKLFNGWAKFEQHGLLAQRQQLLPSTATTGR